MNNHNEIHVAMVGSSGSGKSAILERLQGRPFTPLYRPTSDITVYEVDVGDYRFIVSEYPGTRFYQAEDFAHVTAYILVVEAPSRLSRNYGNTLQAVMPDNIPSAKMLNKSELSSLPLTPDSCSAKNKTNLERAFLSIAQMYE
jgi:hypothetical protein